MASTIEVIGMEKALAALGPARFAQFPLALKRGGLAIQAEMQAAARPHHDTGNLERNIHVEGPFGTGIRSEIRIGISTKAAPEGRPLAFGWSSTSGKRPPVAAIEAWLWRHPEASKGLKSDLNRKGGDLVFRTAEGGVGRRGSLSTFSAQSQVRSRAFAIAAAIGKRGFSFGSGKGGQKADWFHEGIKAGKPKLYAIVRAALRPGAKP